MSLDLCFAMFCSVLLCFAMFLLCFAMLLLCFARFLVCFALFLLCFDMLCTVLLCLATFWYILLRFASFSYVLLCFFLCFAVFSPLRDRPYGNFWTICPVALQWSGVCIHEWTHLCWNWFEAKSAKHTKIYQKHSKAEQKHCITYQNITKYNKHMAKHGKT